MKQRGISLIEVLISIAIIGGTIAVFAVLLNIMRLNKTGSLYTAAYKLAQGEIEAIRSLPFNELANRTDSEFINVIYNNGELEILSGQLKISASSTCTGLALLPFNNTADFTAESQVKSPDLTNKLGIVFRARDLENNYFYYIKNDRIVLEKNAGGSISTLYESIMEFNSNTDYKLKIAAAGSNISLYLDEILMQTVSDSAFSSGYIALSSENKAAYFDNVGLAFGSQSFYWDFNQADGPLPDDWKRFGLYDMPDGTGTLTISEPYSGLKKIKAVVTWKERGETKTVSLSTLRAE